MTSLDVDGIAVLLYAIVVVSHEEFRALCVSWDQVLSVYANQTNRRQGGGW